MAGRHPNPKPGCHPQFLSLPHSPLQGPLLSPLTNPRASAFSRPQDCSPAKGVCHPTCLPASNLISLSEPASRPKRPCHSPSSMASPPLQPGQKTTRVRPALAVRVLPAPPRPLTLSLCRTQFIPQTHQPAHFAAITTGSPTRLPASGETQLDLIHSWH